MSLVNIISTSFRYQFHNLACSLGKFANISALSHRPTYDLFVSVRPNGQILREIMTYLSKKLIRPIVDRVFPTKDVREALYYVKSGHCRGKVIVLIQSSGRYNYSFIRQLEKDEDLSSPSTIFSYDLEQNHFPIYEKYY